jgi:hypothetical protein
MFSPSVSLISSSYLPVHSNIIAIAEAAAVPPPPTAAAVVLFFAFSKKGPFQGHALTLQGNIVYFLHILLILDVFHQFQQPCYFF